MNENKTEKELVSEILTKLKEERGLTNKDIAKSLNYEETTVQKWISGKNNISLKDVGNLCREYGINPVEFFEVENKNVIKNSDFISLNKDFKNTREIYEIADVIIKYDSNNFNDMMKKGQKENIDYIMEKRNLLISVLIIVWEIGYRDYQMVIEVLCHILSVLKWHNGSSCSTFVIDGYLEYYECCDNILDYEPGEDYYDRYSRYICCLIFDTLFSVHIDIEEVKKTYKWIWWINEQYDVYEKYSYISRSDMWYVESLINDLIADVASYSSGRDQIVENVFDEEHMKLPKEIAQKIKSAYEEMKERKESERKRLDQEFEDRKKEKLYFKSDDIDFWDYYLLNEGDCKKQYITADDNDLIRLINKCENKKDLVIIKTFTEFMNQHENDYAQYYNINTISEKIRERCDKIRHDDNVKFSAFDEILDNWNDPIWSDDTESNIIQKLKDYLKTYEPDIYERLSDKLDVAQEVEMYEKHMSHAIITESYIDQEMHMKKLEQIRDYLKTILKIENKFTKIFIPILYNKTELDYAKYLLEYVEEHINTLKSYDTQEFDELE